jgi:hypothetical protein
MTVRPRYAVIPTHDRPDHFATCLRSVWDQVDHVLVISHRAAYVGQVRADSLTVLPYDQELPNISAMWNLGLLEAEVGSYAMPHDVAVLNDDAVVPPGWFDQVTAAMRETGAAAGCASQDEDLDSPFLQTTPDTDIGRRLSGYAFILDGADGLRADEQFRWWWGDTDLDWRARQQGGTVLVPGVPVEHPPNGSTPTTGVLAQIAGDDRQRFIDKWGSAPW